MNRFLRNTSIQLVVILAVHFSSFAHAAEPDFTPVTEVLQRIHQNYHLEGAGLILLRGEGDLP